MTYVCLVFYLLLCRLYTPPTTKQSFLRSSSMIYPAKYSSALGGWYEYDDSNDSIYLLDTVRRRTGVVLQRPSNMSIASLTTPDAPQQPTGLGSRPNTNARQGSASNPAPNLATERVRTIRFTVHNTGQLVNSQCSDNHTSAYLLLSNNNAVQINMRTEPEYIDGVYEIRDRNYQQSTSEITHFDYLASSHFTARDVHNLLCHEGFNKYTFTGGGIGCRYWKYEWFIAHVFNRQLTLLVSPCCAYWNEKDSCLTARHSTFTRVCLSSFRP